MTSAARVDARELAAVFAGGVAGALARVLLADAFPQAPGQWPWATFAANVAGALVLGWVAARQPMHRISQRLVGTGLCGALTTFSTLQLELLVMLDRAHGALAAAYALASVVAGLAAVALGRALGRRA